MMAKGSCLCGEVTYKFSGTPALQALCHCAPCHKISGSTYTTNLLIPVQNFTVLTGSDNLRSFSMQHPSDLTLTVHFCVKCGTKIYKEGTAKGFKGVVIVQAGTLDGGIGDGMGDARDEMGLGDVVVGAELWVKERVDWVPRRREVAQMEEFS
ncbi:hypothetical protein VTL71DRAFT_10894 [Oculimacula yallundae]|uniref:CENP-V/GFA domain-containing protein n=1 Tax=Oculimacula yallundae TaxID=86028 RepID=A0ABR4CW32_9HELO